MAAQPDPLDGYRQPNQRKYPRQVKSQAESLRVFRWEEKEKAFQPLFRSAPGQTRDCVWADVSEPGLYGVIGVDAHPLVARKIAPSP
jgi:hypothetical protein